MKNNRFSVSKLIFLAVLIIIFLLIGWVALSATQFSGQYDNFELKEGWAIHVNGQQVNYDKSDISTWNMGKTPRGTQVDLDIVLDNRFENDPYTIELLVYVSSVEATLDGQVIYSEGVEEVEANKMCGSGYHFIDIPAGSTGKNLHIHIVSNENNAFTSIAVPEVTKSYDVHLAYANKQRINLFMGSFLIMMGLLMSLTGVVSLFYNNDNWGIIFIGMFAAAMGTWSSCNNMTYAIFGMNRVFWTNMEYGSLYFAPIPFIFLVLKNRAKEKDWRFKMIGAAGLIFVSFYVVAVIMHFANMWRFPASLVTFHIISAFTVIVICFAGFISVKKKSNSEIMMTIAIVEMVISIIIDLSRFNLHKYVMPDMEMLSYSFLPLGTIGFVILLVLSYVINIYDLLWNKVETETLERIAYADALTNLSNRAAFNKDIKELDEEGSDYAIINIDVNGLKEINDTYGHEEGDKLITNFSEIISETFSAIGTCYRIGGDEFVVIVKSRYIAGIDIAFIRLEDAQDRDSRKHKYKLSSSYGVATKSETGSDNYEKAYSLADQRMYEMKEKIHNTKS